MPPDIPMTTPENTVTTPSAVTPPSVARKVLHQRQISCIGYEREDGLWDIDAHMTDIKSYDLLYPDGSVKTPTGVPLHSIRLCITVDSSLMIVNAKADTVRGPYQECPAINDAYASLIGMKIGAGFINQVKKQFKGINGCTHLTELMGPIATTAYQTLWPVLEKGYQAKDQQFDGNPAEKPSPTIDGCYALRSEGEAVQIRWPHFYEAVALERAKQAVVKE